MIEGAVGSAKAKAGGVAYHVFVDRAAAAGGDQRKLFVTRVANGSSGRDPSFDEAKRTIGGCPIFAMELGLERRHS
jgi:hypothetical protein